MSNQLLRCPFCGAAAKSSVPFRGTQKAWCNAEGCENKSTFDVEAWNRRDTQPAAGEPVAWRFQTCRGGQWHVTTNKMHARMFDGTEDGGRVQELFTAAPPAAAHGDEAVQWVECGERLPESGHPVLAFYTNRSGKGRRIRANYVAPKTHEVDFADPDTQCVEYDEEGDCFYLQSGWYELIDNWEEYSSIAVIEGEISHWMPLPAQPAMRVQAGEGGEV